jgi:hypothetical protein
MGSFIPIVSRWAGANAMGACPQKDLSLGPPRMVSPWSRQQQLPAVILLLIVDRRSPTAALSEPRLEPHRHTRVTTVDPCEGLVAMRKKQTDHLAHRTVGFRPLQSPYEEDGNSSALRTL